MRDERANDLKPVLSFLRVDYVGHPYQRSSGEYLDFHPHLHALVADGLFDRERKFHLMRAGELAGELAQEQRGTTAEHLAAMCAIRDELRLLPAPV